MEFNQINTTKFDIKKAPNPYPDSNQDRDGNYPINDDKDFAGGVDSSHYKSDLDSSKFAQHHTLGPRPYQSSPGNHVHDGKTSKKLGEGLGLTLTGSKGGNVALANLITMLKSVVEFTDTTT